MRRPSCRTGASQCSLSVVAPSEIYLQVFEVAVCCGVYGLGSTMDGGGSLVLILHKPTLQSPPCLPPTFELESLTICSPGAQSTSSVVLNSQSLQNLNQPHRTVNGDVGIGMEGSTWVRKNSETNCAWTLVKVMGQDHERPIHGGSVPLLLTVWPHENSCLLPVRCAVIFPASHGRSRSTGGWSVISRLSQRS